MPIYLPKKPWEIKGLKATPEEIFNNRRAFIRKMGWAAGSIAGASVLSALGCGETTRKEKDHGIALDDPTPPVGDDLPPPPVGSSEYWPPVRNPDYTLDREITDENVAASYNNFYEFSLQKTGIAKLTDKFVIDPWSVEVTGLVDNPGSIPIESFYENLDLEERLYRFRCVEAWAMAVPWDGFPMKKFLEWVSPKPEAKYLRFLTFDRPDQAPGVVSTPHYPWPYHEALTIEEASNELTMLAVGIYGHPLPKQHGAPVRLIVPWKYGLKNIKSIVRIEFTDTQPGTFWNELVPDEYSFLSNVEPDVPHPRWSQATERLIDTGERVPTQLYNGYADLVAHLYDK